MARKILTTMKITDEELVNKLEALNYEVNSRRDIIAFMLSGDYLRTEAFAQYQQEYQNFYVQYDLLKKMLEDTYVKPLLKDDQTVSWNLDFASGELEIYE